jgi:hypothetical protein
MPTMSYLEKIKRNSGGIPLMFKVCPGKIGTFLCMKISEPHMREP